MSEWLINNNNNNTHTHKQKPSKALAFKKGEFKDFRVAIETISYLFLLS